MTIVVNISDARVSDDPRYTLATYSLGSCIAVALYDPVACVGGLLHFQLPSSVSDPERAKDNPYLFADTGLQCLLARMGMLGASQKRLKVRIAGGASMLNDAGMFDIGRRNHQSIRKILWQYGMFLEKEDCGGSQPRSVYLNVANGGVSIKTTGETVTI